jgi:hypothetical protein
MALISLLLTLVGLNSQAPDAQALFSQGATYEAFLENATAQKTIWQANTARATVPAEVVERFKKAAAGLTLLVIAEAACSDSVQTLPYVAKLASLAGVELRIVGKSAGQAVLEHHKSPDNRTATPTVVLLRDGKDVGAFVERPVTLQTWMTGFAQTLSQQERLSRKASWYDWDRGDSTVAEVVALAEKTAR